MDIIDREILLFLSTRETIAIGAVSQVGNIPFEDLSAHVERGSYLRRKELIEYLEPIGNPVFLRITEKGRKALKSFCVNIMDFIFTNWFSILSTVISIIALLISLMSYKK